MIRNEIHIYEQPHVGHTSTPDCWCEPHIELHDPDAHGVTVVIQHCDWTSYPHQTVVEKRSERPGWVTKVLNEIG